MSRKRTLFIAFLALLASLLIVPGAAGGNFDEQRMGCAGEDPGICPTATTGQAYTLPIELLGDEDEGCAVYTVASGMLPPGLTLYSDEAKIRGTPTEAGSFGFYLNVAYNRQPSCPFKNPSDDRFVINVVPGLPKLTIGPESAPVGTVATPYSLQMTATVTDAKTWSIVAGSLPAGLTIGATDGLISGTPSAAGTFNFTVRAAVTADQRSDTKALAIVVREPLAISRRSVPKSEVGVRFLLPFGVTGGNATYTWSLTGTLPSGVTFAPNGVMAGIPEEPGSFPFTVTAADTEGRTTTSDGVIVVAERLEILAQTFRPAKVGRFYRARLRATGGVQPALWRITRGPLPRGVTFDRVRGLFVGTPKRARTYRIGVEIRDALGVKSTTTVVLVVQPAAKPRKRTK